MNVDIFGDGSCDELVTFDNNLDTVNFGTLTAAGSHWQYADGPVCKSVEGTGQQDGDVSYLYSNTDYSFTGAKDNDCSISFFIKPVLFPQGVTNPPVEFYISLSLSAFGTIAVYTYKDSNGNTFLICDYSDESGVGRYIMTLDSDITSSEYHHIALVANYSNTTFTVYLDGASLGTSSGLGNRTNISLVPTGLYVLGLKDTNDNVYTSSGGVDQLRLFTKALSDTEVSTLYDERLRTCGPHGEVLVTATAAAHRRLASKGTAAVAVTSGVTAYSKPLSKGAAAVGVAGSATAHRRLAAKGTADVTVAGSATAHRRLAAKGVAAVGVAGGAAARRKVEAEGMAAVTVAGGATAHRRLAAKGVVAVGVAGGATAHRRLAAEGMAAVTVAGSATAHRRLAAKGVAAVAVAGSVIDYGFSTELVKTYFTLSQTIEPFSPPVVFRLRQRIEQNPQITATIIRRVNG